MDLQSLIKRVQASLNLEVDGVAGPATWQAIADKLAPLPKESPRVSVAKTGSLAKKLVEFAREEVGVEEVDGTNCGPRVNAYKAATTLDPKASWPWCFDDSVEILTENGWHNLKKIVSSKEKIKIAQVDQNNLDITFDYPTDYIRKTAPNASRVKARGLDFICDKNHEFFASKNTRNSSPDLIPLSEIKSHVNIPSCFIASKYNQKYSELDLDFIAAFVADGSFHQRSENHKQKIRIQVSKDRKIEVLKCHNGSFYEAKKVYGNSKKPLTTFEFDIPEYFDKIFSDYKEFKWEWVFSLCSEQMKFFLERYSFWDGCYKRKNISTCREQNRDIFVAMGIMAGMHPNSSLRMTKSGKECFEISLGNKKTRMLQASNIYEYNETIELYCVTMPKGLIIVRDSKGTPFLTGNCAAFICWLFREAMKNSKYSFSRPNTASAWGFEDWARGENDSIKLQKPHNNDIKSGDIVIFTFSHIGLAISGIDSSGYIQTIEGNTDGAGSREGGAVLQKKRHISQIRSRIRTFE